MALRRELQPCYSWSLQGRVSLFRCQREAHEPATDLQEMHVLLVSLLFPRKHREARRTGREPAWVRGGTARLRLSCR